MSLGSMIAGGVGIAAAAGVGVSMLRAATTYKAKPIKDAIYLPLLLGSFSDVAVFPPILNPST